ncbi:uncharacterized protein LOC129905650, partial [Episyrphus balteatus]|uniref:uncharacterized protein LOC129905650 n=1 Tax=Episyrphus balteatus TaxID=286459 RepID=UPI002486683B
MDNIKPNSLSMEGNLAMNFDIFLKDFNIYMEATEKNKKSPACQKANFLNYIGSEARQKYYTWDIASKPEASLEEVQKQFKEYCNPKKNAIYERIKFYKRIQKPGEPFDNFLKDLRVLSDGCDFNSEKDNMVRDFIILGINIKDLGDKLMNTINLSLESTINTCRVAELEVTRIKEVHEVYPTEVSMIN